MQKPSETLRRPGQHCHPSRYERIQALLVDLCIIYDRHAVDPGKFAKEDARACVQEILQECDRLMLKPGQFKTPAEAQSFFSSVDRFVCEIISPIHANEGGDTSIGSIDTRPSRTSNDKPWSHYLRNLAAEERARGAVLPRALSFQILPPAACRLLLTWSKNDAEVASAIHQVSTHFISPETATYIYH